MKITSHFQPVTTLKGRSQTTINDGMGIPSDSVEISEAASGQPGKSEGLGRIGKAAGILALAGLMLGTSGCAVYGGYGYGGDFYQGHRHGYYQTVPNFGYGVPTYNYGGHGCVGNSWGGGVCY